MERSTFSKDHILTGKNKAHSYLGNLFVLIHANGSILHICNNLCDEEVLSALIRHFKSLYNTIIFLSKMDKSHKTLFGSL